MDSGFFIDKIPLDKCKKVLYIVKDGEHKIMFQGQEWLLIGTREDGAICTREQYENFILGYAHLMPDGRILRHGVQIGTIDDIQFIEGESQ